MNRIPFNVPYRAPFESEYIHQAIAAGLHSGSGAFHHACRDLLAKTIGGGPIFLTTSGTAALELATLAANISDGDEVVMPSFTFPSTANAVVLRGGRPVFVDVDATNFNIDPDALAAAVTDRTRAVIVVHYGGVTCDMDRILAITRRHGLVLIEDAAHAIGSSLDGRPAGSFGDYAAFSFHHSKNVTCGEGGCLVVNDRGHAARVEILYEKGTDRRRFEAGFVDKYKWVDVGSSYVLGELNAAMLLAQLECLDAITRARHRICQQYDAFFRNHAIADRFGCPDLRPAAISNGHLYPVVLGTAEERTAFLDWMGRHGISALSHYVPLHSAPAGRRFGRVAGSMHVTDSVAERLVRLPLYPSLAPHVERVTNAMRSWMERMSRP